MAMLTSPATARAMTTSVLEKRSSLRRSRSLGARARPWVSAECRYIAWGITVAPMMPSGDRRSASAFGISVQHGM